MEKKRALKLAIAFLSALEEAGNIFDDYIEDEHITAAEYGEMLASLKVVAQVVDIVSNEGLEVALDSMKSLTQIFENTRKLLL